MTAMTDDAGPTPEPATPASEPEIRALLARLGRPHASGGTVIERAALMAEGADFEATIAWILAHGGEPEAAVAAAPSGGLHGSRTDGGGRASGSSRPRRFVLPAGALTG
jgi:hypothetical protein